MKEMFPTHKYLIELHSEKLCFQLLETLFSDQKSRIKGNPALASQFFAVAANFMDMASNPDYFDDDQYKTYIKDVLFHAAYVAAKSNPENIVVYQYAIDLRKLFEADETLLQGYNLNRFGALPTAEQIQGLLQPRFILLEKTFRSEYKAELVTIDNIDTFLKEKIAKIQDTIETTINSNQSI